MTDMRENQIAASEKQKEDHPDTGKRRKRGRPRKESPVSQVDPDILHNVVCEIRSMAREYAHGDLQADVRYIRTARPRLLKNAGICDTDDDSGGIRYDERSVAVMPEEDQRMISRYISSKEKMDFLRKNIEAISEAQIREVARDTLLKGIPVMNLTWKYGLCDRSIRMKKRRALDYLAKQYLICNFTQIFPVNDRWRAPIIVD